MGKIAQLVIVVAATVALLAIARLAWIAGDVVSAVPARMESAIAAEGREFRELLVDELADTRRELREESVEYRKLLRGELGEARAAAVSESAAWRRETSGELAALRRTLAEELGGAVRLADGRLETVTTAAVRTLDAYAAIPPAVGAELAPYWRCKGNGACWPAQATALLGAARVTAGRTSIAMGAVAAAAPSIVGSVDRTANHIERMTRPATLIERVLRIAAPAAGGAVLGVFK